MQFCHILCDFCLTPLTGLIQDNARGARGRCGQCGRCGVSWHQSTTSNFVLVNARSPIYPNKIKWKITLTLCCYLTCILSINKLRWNCILGDLCKLNKTYRSWRRMMSCFHFCCFFTVFPVTFKLTNFFANQLTHIQHDAHNVTTLPLSDVTLALHNWKCLHAEQLCGDYVKLRFNHTINFYGALDFDNGHY